MVPAPAETPELSYYTPGTEDKHKHPSREPEQAGSQERRNLETLILLQQDQSRPVMSVTCNHTQ